MELTGGSGEGRGLRDIMTVSALDKLLLEAYK